MLQKEFFQVQPFNPNPYWDPVIVNLSGAQKFEEDAVFKPGRYRVVVNAGSTNTLGGTIHYPVVIQKDVAVNTNFIVRAYCGSKSDVNTGLIGTNPYSGEFKVNGYTSRSVIPSVSHIFGNAGSAGFFSSSGTPPIPNEVASSGNCLGNGVFTSRGNITFATASSAGSCLHFMPVGGVFGTDYLFAFHSAGVPGRYGNAFGGGGSAYGGAASGGVQQGGYSGVSTPNGGSAPYGTGGAGVTDRISGNNGTGIGNGKNNGYGAGAFFDGQSWNDETNYATSAVDGVIKVEYLGPLN